MTKTDFKDAVSKKGRIKVVGNECAIIKRDNGRFWRRRWESDTGAACIEVALVRR